MKKNKEVTCRYGVTYKLDAIGPTEGSIIRLFDLMTHCCCWVCHNRDCKYPKNEIVSDCNNVCEIYTKIPYCKK